MADHLNRGGSSDASTGIEAHPLTHVVDELSTYNVDQVM